MMAQSRLSTRREPSTRRGGDNTVTFAGEPFSHERSEASTRTASVESSSRAPCKGACVASARRASQPTVGRRASLSTQPPQCRRGSIVPMAALQVQDAQATRLQSLVAQGYIAPQQLQAPVGTMNAMPLQGTMNVLPLHEMTNQETFASLPTSMHSGRTKTAS